jgi:hypothetical protein
METKRTHRDRFAAGIPASNFIRISDSNLFVELVTFEKKILDLFWRKLFWNKRNLFYY